MKNIIVTVLFVLVSLTGLAETRAVQSLKSQNTKPDEIFNDFRNGVINNNIAEFTRHFQGDVLIKLRNGVADYFSPNQAYFVLKDFFDSYQVISFGYKNISEDGNFPSASGELNYKHNGMNGSALAFISLEKKNNEWVIVQITIN